MLKVGEEKTIGKVSVKFVDFDFPQNQREAMLEGKDVEIGARLMVSQDGSKPVEVVPRKSVRKGEMQDEPATFANAFEFTLGQLRPDQDNPGNSSVQLSVKDLAVNEAAAQAASGKGDVLVIEATLKPFINLVWSGLIILLIGFVVTIYRRFQEGRPRAVPAQELESTPAGVQSAVLLDEAVR
jgi:cytochrome c-type biogenesis protein CcmF